MVVRFNVLVKINRSCHLDLWTATRGIRNELLLKYARGLWVDDFGIYLVLWFG